MKKIFLIMLWIFNYNLLAQEYVLGQESVDKIRFPKFYAQFSYGILGKINILNKEVKSIKIDNEQQYSFFTEHNLYKYMNAGFKFDGFYRKLKDDTKHVKSKLAIFIKPFIPLYKDEVSLYTTFGGGVGNALLMPIYGTGLYNQNAIFIPSINVENSIGINYFPFFRFGFFAQANYITELNMGNRGDKDARDLVWFIDHRLSLGGGLSFIF